MPDASRRSGETKLLPAHWPPPSRSPLSSRRPGEYLIDGRPWIAAQQAPQGKARAQRTGEAPPGPRCSAAAASSLSRCCILVWLVPSPSRPPQAPTPIRSPNADAPQSAAKASATRNTQGKAERLNAAKQQRDRKRAELLQQRRMAGAPRVVALLPLSAAVDAARLWADLLQACQAPQRAAPPPAGGGSCGMEVEDAGKSSSGTPSAAVVMQTAVVAERRRLSFTLVPPPVDRSDPLVVVDLGRAADVSRCHGLQLQLLESKYPPCCSPRAWSA